MERVGWMACYTHIILDYDTLVSKLLRRERLQTPTERCSLVDNQLTKVEGVGSSSERIIIIVKISVVWPASRPPTRRGREIAAMSARARARAIARAIARARDETRYDEIG